MRELKGKALKTSRDYTGTKTSAARAKGNAEGEKCL